MAIAAKMAKVTGTYDSLVKKFGERRGVRMHDVALTDLRAEALKLPPESIADVAVQLSGVAGLMTFVFLEMTVHRRKFHELDELREYLEEINQRVIRFTAGAEGFDLKNSALPILCEMDLAVHKGAAEPLEPPPEFRHAL